jgi:carboxyl-terminal processing protease
MAGMRPNSRILILAAALAMAVAACTVSFGTDTTTDSTRATGTSSSSASPAPTTSTIPITSTTETIGSIDVSVVGCADASEPFATLCRMVDLVNDRFVDDVDIDRLVAGAVDGIEQIQSREDVGETPTSFDCAIPADAYAPICDAIATDLVAGDGGVDALVVQAMQGMLEFGIDDPFSAYFSPEALDLFSTNQSGAVEGIGALVQAREPGDDGTDLLCNLLSAACRIYIVTPLEGSPAESAGILSGDVIAGVDGSDVEGRTFDEVTATVRGPAGTDVRLTIDRSGEVFDVTVTRASIDIPISESRMLDDTTGYLRLTSFTNNAASVVREELNRLLDTGADTLIFDLQGNPGGSLNAAVQIASEFLADGIVLRTEARDGGETFDVVPGGVATSEVRLVLLVNEGSASASEVVAGALQEAGRAVLIGENTFGKNTVQRIWNLPNGGGLKLTTSRWVTPNGVDYGIDGITPNVLIEIPQDATSQFLIDTALEYLAELEISG